MIVYKCNKCGTLNEKQTKCFRKEKDVPDNWITMDLNFYNNNQPTETSIKLMGTLPVLFHFCSKKCFLDYFFHPDEVMKGAEENRKRIEANRKRAEVRKSTKTK
jgi:hypothetical protein